MADLKVMTQPNSFTASFFSLNRSSINETLIKSIFIYTSAITSYLQMDFFCSLTLVGYQEVILN